MCHIKVNAADSGDPVSRRRVYILLVRRLVWNLDNTVKEHGVGSKLLSRNTAQTMFVVQGCCQELQDRPAVLNFL